MSEYVEYLQQSEDIEYDLTDVSEFGKEPNGDPWSRKTKKLVIQLYFRREIRRGFKAWFRKQLNRPTLRVIKIENDTVEYGDERGKYEQECPCTRYLSRINLYFFQIWPSAVSHES